MIKREIFFYKIKNLILRENENFSVLEQLLMQLRIFYLERTLHKEIMKPNGEQNKRKNGRILFRIKKAKRLDENTIIKCLKERKTVKFKECMISKITI